ncbi:MAG TPA: J domain-containing protein [Burkholderiaceae bacterium]|nr:J domain-containing protein [Burkholderiaceae bacterium]
MATQTDKPRPIRALDLAASGDLGTQTPVRRKFDQWMKKVNAAKTELTDWDAAQTAFSESFVALIEPLRREAIQARLRFARQLDEVIAKGWARTSEQDLCEELLLGLVSDISSAPQLDDAQRAELGDMYQRHRDMTLEQARQEELAELKRMTEETIGVELGAEPIADEQELMRRMLEGMTDRYEHEFAQARAREAARAARRAARPKSAAQLRREAAEQGATDSLRDIYRRLASALHPDRATDEADRQRRHDLMVRVNQAHRLGDLPALLMLQLEFEQIDPAHLAQASEERVQHYIVVLQQQHRDLGAQLNERRMRFGNTFGVEMSSRAKALHLGQVLQEMARQLRAEVAMIEADLAQIMDKRGAHRWIKARAADRAVDEDLSLVLQRLGAMR